MGAKEYPTAGYYPPREQVRVTTEQSPRRGQIGTVTSTCNIAGDMRHTVEFADGDRADFWADDLLSVRGGRQEAQPAPKAAQERVTTNDLFAADAAYKRFMAGRKNTKT